VTTTRDAKKQKALEAAGFRVGDAADFLELTDLERSLVDLRLAVSRAVRERRKSANLTQAQVAARMKSTQARVAKIEAGDTGVSLDLMFSGLFAVGGRLSDLTETSPAKATLKASREDRS
jgi:ribosome-binding protein aMBF1 (putative translation factor)